MSVSQLNEDFNDAIETYFDRKGRIKKNLLGTYDSLLVHALRLRRWIFRGERLINERIVEYTQVVRWLRGGGTVLDIGCSSSRLPLQLASLGYTVHGLDVRPFPLRHRNFTFYRGDLFSWEPPLLYDAVLLVSTLEHIGMGRYGERKMADADFQAVRRICGWLKDGGQLLVSVPFGREGQTRIHRVYSLKRLQRLFSQFRWQRQRYFRRVEDSWLPVPPQELMDVASPDLPPNGVAVLDLRKMRPEGARK